MSLKKICRYIAGVAVFLAGLVIILKVIWPDKINASWENDASLIVLGFTLILWGIKPVWNAWKWVWGE